MLRKYATAEIIGAEIARPNTGLIKNAHRAKFDYAPRPGFLYVRSRMISSRCNDNHDEFPAEEIRKAWKTAIGKPVFVNHHNEDHRRMRGVIIDAALHEDMLPDGKPDVWIEALHELDARRFPRLAQAILKRRVSRTSMGTDVGFSVCSACGNKASTPAEYCDHIPRMKGKILYRHTASGQREGHLIREICYKLGFFENSFLVEDPADPTAVVTGVDDRGLKSTAAKDEPIPWRDRPEGAPPAVRDDMAMGRDGTHFVAADPAIGPAIMPIDSTEQCVGCGTNLQAKPYFHVHRGDTTVGVCNDCQKEMGLQVKRGQPDYLNRREAPRNVPQGTMPLLPLKPSLNSKASSLPRVAGLFRQKRVDWQVDPNRKVQDLGNNFHLLNHLAEAHGWGHDAFQSAGKEGFRAAHDRLHREGVPGLTDPEGMHFHGARSSLPKVADYYVSCDRDGCHSSHWGPHGAAGLLVRHHDPEDGETRYLLQKRAPWVDHGGTWGIPGGAIHEDETPREGAEREAEEEMGSLPDGLTHHQTHTDDHGGWAYHTVVLDSPERFEPGQGDDESTGHGWFTKHEMKNMDLHPGFAQSLHKVTRNERTASSLPRVAELDDDEIMKGLNLPTAEQGHQDIRHEKAKDLADSLIAPLYEPYGGHENYLLHMDNESMQHLQNRYRGGTGRFAFDEESEAEGERAEPYYEIKHTTPEGRHTGWKIRHYADGPMAEIRHDATPGEAHDVIDIGREIDHSTHDPFGRHQPPDDFGHNELAAELHDWVNNDTSGIREHLEGKYGDSRIRRYKQRYPNGKLPPRESSLPHVAYGETKAPQDVDTLRTESCPVCGENDAFDGDRCQVCNFVQPPAMFTDPDTSVARQMDLKKDTLDQQSQVGPDGQPIPGQGDVDPNDPNGENQPMTDMPGMPGDQIADLFCPACGFSADTQEPMTNNDPSMPSEQQGLQEGDVCPNCGQATMLSPNDVGELGGEVPQEVADDADANGIPDDQEPDEDQDGIPDQDEPDVDNDGKPDDAERDSDADGTPDDADPDDEDPTVPDPDAGEDEEADEDAAPVEDDDEAQKGRKDNARRASRRGQTRMRETMTKQQPKAAATSSKIAALEKKIADQDRTIRAQAVALDVAGQQLHYLATVAGVAKEFDAIKREGAKKVADIMNPAQPIPDPPGGAPTETTEQAEAPETFDDPRNPGLTPGSTNGVPAQQVDSPLVPGVTLDTSPYANLVDVTQPVEGTQEHVPLDQTKIETDVRVGDPMANAGAPESFAFPLTGPFAQDGAASANTVTSPGMQRTMACLRLAKLRKSAGLIPREQDELLVAAELERTASLTDPMIEHEITTLESVAKQIFRTSGRRPKGGPLPKQAANERRVPSLAAAASMSATAGSGDAGFGADDASDLFISDSLASE